MNATIFLLYTICFLAYLSHGMEDNGKNGGRKLLKQGGNLLVKKGVVKTLHKNSNAAKDPVSTVPQNIQSSNSKELVKKLHKNSNAAKDPVSTVPQNIQSSNAMKNPQRTGAQLCFESDAPVTVTAFYIEKKERLGTSVPEKRKMNDKETIWQCVKIKEIFWFGLDDKKVVTFKNAKGEVLGSATVGTLSFVNESAERKEEDPLCLYFTVQCRDYYHFRDDEINTDVPRVIILYKEKSKNTPFLFFKKVKLQFKKRDWFKVKAFRGNNEMYSDQIKAHVQNGNKVWEYVMIAVYEKQWNGLDDNEKITFKAFKNENDKLGEVLGSATAQLLVKTTTVWLHFYEPKDYYYYCSNEYDYYVKKYDNHGVYYKDDNGNASQWSRTKLLF